jgi:FtsH-binding integral membrane protein
MYPSTENENLSNNPYIVGTFDDFEDKTVRKSFIRKTFTYFFSSILVTLSSCILFKFIPECSKFAYTETGQALYTVSMITNFMSIFTLICCGDLARKSPQKYILYYLFTFSLSYLIGMSVIRIPNDIVVSAILITTGITFNLTVYAIFTKSDFTDLSGYLIAVLMGIIITSIVNLFLHNSILQIMIAGAGSILFSCFIVYDVQMIVGNKHIKYKYNKDDYIFAALNLYLDVINLFLYVMECLTLSNSN